MGNKDSKLNFDFSHDHPVVTLKKPKVRVFPKQLATEWPLKYQRLFQDTPVLLGYNYTSYHLKDGQLTPIESQAIGQSAMDLAQQKVNVVGSMTSSQATSSEQALTSLTSVTSVDDSIVNSLSVVASVNPIGDSVTVVSSQDAKPNSDADYSDTNTHLDAIKRQVMFDGVNHEHGIGGVNIDSDISLSDMEMPMYTLGGASNQNDDSQSPIQSDVKSTTPVNISLVAESSDSSNSIHDSTFDNPLSSFDTNAWLDSNLPDYQSSQMSFDEIHALLHSSMSDESDTDSFESVSSSVDAGLVSMANSQVTQQLSSEITSSLGSVSTSSNSMLNHSVSDDATSLSVEDDPALDYDYDGDSDAPDDDYVDDNEYEDDLSDFDTNEESDDVEDDDFDDDEELLADELDDKSLNLADDQVFNQRYQQMLDQQMLSQDDLQVLNHYLVNRLGHLNAVLDRYQQLAQQNYFVLRERQSTMLAYAKTQANLVEDRAKYQLKIVRSFATQKLNEYEASDTLVEHRDELKYLQHRMREAQHHVFDVKQRSRQLLKRIRAQVTTELNQYCQQVADKENYLLLQIDMMRKHLVH